MARVKRGVIARARHKKILKLAKGYYGARSRVFRVAKQAVIKAGQYAYRDRRQRKRQFRALWIARINAGARVNGLSYSRLIAGLKKASIEIDCKVLADLAVNEKAAFAAIVEKAKAILAKSPDNHRVRPVATSKIGEEPSSSSPISYLESVHGKPGCIGLASA